MPGTEDIVNKIYDQIFADARRQNDEQFAPQRAQLINEEGALGRLRSPASILSLSRFDTQKNNALANIFGGLLQGKATGTLQNDQFGRSLAETAREADMTNALGGAKLKLLKDQGDDERNGLTALLGNIKTGTDIAGNIFGAGKRGGILGA